MEGMAHALAASITRLRFRRRKEQGRQISLTCLHWEHSATSARRTLGPKSRVSSDSRPIRLRSNVRQIRGGPTDCHEADQLRSESCLGQVALAPTEGFLEGSSAGPNQFGYAVEPVDCEGLAGRMRSSSIVSELAPSQSHSVRNDYVRSMQAVNRAARSESPNRLGRRMEAELAKGGKK